MVLKELKKTSQYPNFHSTVRAFANLNALDTFAKDMLPVVKACYDLNKPIEFAAQKLNTLTEMQSMIALLNIAENKLDGGR